MEDVEIILISIAFCILALGLVGNIALSVIVFEQLPHQPDKKYSYFILNLAISDVLLVSSCVPFDMVERLQQSSFPFGATVCKLLWPFQTICGMASIFTVGALSYQRYKFIVQPWKGKMSSRMFMLIMTLIWSSPVILAGVPYSFVLRLDENTSKCFEEWSVISTHPKMKLSFTVYLFTIQYVLPLSIIVWCNVKAIRKLKRYIKYRRRHSAMSKLSMENHRNVIKMLIAIMAVFALFWLPGQVMTIMLEFEPENSFILNYGLNVAYLFAFSNCVANPLIFAYYSNDHRMLHPRLFATSKTPGNSTNFSETHEYRSSIRDTKGIKERECAGTSLMRNFSRFLNTMKEDRAKIYLDSTKETVLN